MYYYTKDACFEMREDCTTNCRGGAPRVGELKVGFCRSPWMARSLDRLSLNTEMFGEFVVSRRAASMLQCCQSRWSETDRNRIDVEVCRPLARWCRDEIKEIVDT